MDNSKELSQDDDQKELIVMSGTRVEAHKDPVLKHRLTIEDFHKMGEAGIFTEEARVELIEGELFDMPLLGRYSPSMEADWKEIL
jgi:hypothetical protein